MRRDAVAELLPHLFARGVTGRSSGEDARLLAWLADPAVNIRVFGQPLPATLWYYQGEFWRLLTGREEGLPGEQ
jgi:hypothetical protein